jgi:AcrR family transcriptional regulator
MGRPAKFSRARLQTAALALVDRHGLSGLSMRALAAKLGTGPMTLYNHVAHREDLELLVIEAVVGRMVWPKTDHDDWRASVRALALALWRAVRAHPHVIPLILTRRSRSPAILEASEALLRRRSGRAKHALLIAFRSVQALIMGFAQVELAGPLSRAAGERPQAVIRRFRSLPAERYPRLIEIATAAMTSEAETEFRAGLDLLLQGLESGRD